MSTLGDFFPDSFREEFSQARGILPGDVIRIHCDFTTPPKFKLLVIVCCDPLLVLIVNSEIHDYIQTNQNLLDCQVDLPESDHDFLDHDSHVNCVEAHTSVNIDDLKASIAADYGSVLRGRVLDVYMREIYIAVGKSKRMERRDKRRILAALDDYK